MKHKLYASAALALALSAGLALLPKQASADDGSGANLIGSWKVIVNVATPPGFPSFPVMMTFHSDGTLLSSRLGYNPLWPAGALLQGTGHGAWNRQHGVNIATFETLVQGAPGSSIPNGAFYAIEKVKLRPVVSYDGNSFSAQWSSAYLDPNGNVIVQGGGTLSAVRVQPEP